MTASEHPGLDRIALDRHGADTGLAQLGVIRDLYAEVYAEPPYGEGPADVTEFAAGWPQRITLLVRPDAPAPRHAYRSWGYYSVGRVQPFPDGPVYDAMIKPRTAAALRDLSMRLGLRVGVGSDGGTSGGGLGGGSATKPSAGAGPVRAGLE